jgi:Uma2 family endonuclease
MTATRNKCQPYRFSREQYYQLGKLGYFEGKRVERIRGEIVEMSPIGWNHVISTRLIADLLRVVFHGLAWVNESGPIPTEDSDPQPDVMVVVGTVRDYTDHPTTALLIVEVADATLDRDLTVKAELYATANIPDYWVLDLNSRQLHVFRDPAAIPDGGQAYRSHTILVDTVTVSPLAMPTAAIRISEILPQ